MTGRPPPRASLEWLRTTSKQDLRALHLEGMKLDDARLAVARDHGFPSWRELQDYMDAGWLPPAAEEEIASFLRAVGDGDIEKVGAALAASPSLVDRVGQHPFWGGRPQALHVAIETGREDVFQLLIEAGADVNGRNDDYDGWSPLMLACSRERPGMRQVMLDRGARAGLVETLLMADDERLSRFARLLRLGRAALPSSVPNGGSILAFARTPFAIDRLLELGVRADLPDRWGATPVDAISRSGPQASALIAHLKRRHIAVAPHHHARTGDRAELATMVDADPAVAGTDRVLIAAVEGGHTDLVSWLVGLGADANARSEAASHHTALHGAAWNGDLQMVRLLVQLGADPGALDMQYESTPEGWATTSVEVTNNPDCEAVAAWLAALPKRGCGEPTGEIC